MHCEQAEMLLGQHVFDELEDAPRAELESHLADCPVCSEKLGDMRLTAAMLRDAVAIESDPVLSDERRDRVLQAITSSTPTVLPWRERHPRVWRGVNAVFTFRGASVAAAAVLMCVGLLGLLLPAMGPARRSASMNREFAASSTLTESGGESLSRVDSNVVMPSLAYGFPTEGHSTRSSNGRWDVAPPGTQGGVTQFDLRTANSSTRSGGAGPTDKFVTADKDRVHYGHVRVPGKKSPDRGGVDFIPPSRYGSDDNSDFAWNDLSADRPSDGDSLAAIVPQRGDDGWKYSSAEPRKVALGDNLDTRTFSTQAGKKTSGDDAVAGTTYAAGVRVTDRSAPDRPVDQFPNWAGPRVARDEKLGKDGDGEADNRQWFVPKNGESGGGAVASGKKASEEFGVVLTPSDDLKQQVSDGTVRMTRLPDSAQKQVQSYFSRLGRSSASDSVPVPDAAEPTGPGRFGRDLGKDGQLSNGRAVDTTRPGDSAKRPSLDDQRLTVRPNVATGASQQQGQAQALSELFNEDRDKITQLGKSGVDYGAYAVPPRTPAKLPKLFKEIEDGDGRGVVTRVQLKGETSGQTGGVRDDYRLGFANGHQAASSQSIPGGQSAMVGPNTTDPADAAPQGAGRTAQFAGALDALSGEDLNKNAPDDAGVRLSLADAERSRRLLPLKGVDGDESFERGYFKNNAPAEGGQLEARLTRLDSIRGRERESGLLERDGKSAGAFKELERYDESERRYRVEGKPADPKTDEPTGELLDTVPLAEAGRATTGLPGHRLAPKFAAQADPAKSASESGSSRHLVRGVEGVDQTVGGGKFEGLRTDPTNQTARPGGGGGGGVIDEATLPGYYDATGGRPAAAGEVNGKGKSNDFLPRFSDDIELRRDATKAEVGELMNRSERLAKQGRHADANDAVQQAKLVLDQNRRVIPAQEFESLRRKTTLRAAQIEHGRVQLQEDDSRSLTTGRQKTLASRGSDGVVNDLFDADIEGENRQSKPAARSNRELALLDLLKAQKSAIQAELEAASAPNARVTPGVSALSTESRKRSAESAEQSLKWRESHRRELEKKLAVFERRVVEEQARQNKELGQARGNAELRAVERLQREIRSLKESLAEAEESALARSELLARLPADVLQKADNAAHGSALSVYEDNADLPTNLRSRFSESKDRVEQAAREHTNGEVQRLLRRANDLRKEQQYDAALGLLDQAKFLDPKNEAVHALTDVIQDTKVFREAKKHMERRATANARHSTTSRGATIPAADAMNYPTDWPQVTASRMSGPTPGEAALNLRTKTALVDRSITVDFKTNRLDGVIDHIRQQTGLNIFVNWAGLESVGIERDTPVTLSLKNKVSAEKALRLVLAQTGSTSELEPIGFNVVEGVVNISTERDLKRDEWVEQAEPDDTPLPPASNFKAGPVNPWELTAQDHQSTFALDVDTASYSLSRNYIRRGFLPPAAAVRMEEFVNAFDYNYPTQGDSTFSVHAEAARSPFAPSGERRTLLKVGVRGKVIGRDQRKPAHLVFVVDISGSMARGDRLPLVQHALRLAVDQLNENDRVTLIGYRTKDYLLLDALRASDRNKSRITRMIDALQAGGPTNLRVGLSSGYEAARASFKPGHINRVILCSDGVANVGQVEADTLLQTVASARSQGITFSAVGFGHGVYNDALMERLANGGDGQYVFVDSRTEAKRVFVDEFTASMQTIAKDAKIQVEFNKERVRRYRLIGYENRAIADKDFRNDSIDAGEVGSGQSSTALYELELVEPKAGELGEQQGDKPAALATVYVRYKDADTGDVAEFARPVSDDLIQRHTPTSRPRLFLAASAAQFAELLRESPHARHGNLRDVQRVMEQVTPHLPLDSQARELLELVKAAQGLPRMK